MVITNPARALQVLKRQKRLFLTFILFFGVYYLSPSQRPGSYPYPEVEDTPPKGETLPPLYERYREYEDLLSEQRLQNSNGSVYNRYIFFANHAHNTGWGNVLQEMVFSSLLAAEANLGFVWDDFTWEYDSKYSKFNDKPIPSRIPLSTMLEGHILGFRQNAESSTSTYPRSISKRAFDKTCPTDRRKIIHRDLVKAHLKNIGSNLELDNASGKEILDAWLSLLDTPQYKNTRCIEVQKDTWHVFDIWLLGSSRVHNLWPILSHSPVLTEWGWSPLVYRAFRKNLQHFISADSISRERQKGVGRLWRILAFLKEPDALANDRVPLPILLLHLRRGDYEQHCENLLGWSAEYNGFNIFPESQIRDAFHLPRVETEIASRQRNESRKRYEDPKVVASVEERHRIFQNHCLPDVTQVVKRVREVVRDYTYFVEEKDKKINIRAERSVEGLTIGNTKLKKVYIMTNGDPSWLSKVKSALKEDAARSCPRSQMEDSDCTPTPEWNGLEWFWEDITTSRDLLLGWEEKPVSQALDMYVAHRAEVFIGNGFSSLTSNTVMLRKMMGFDAVQTRFW